MRYIVARNENNELVIAIWAKSQNRDSKGRECSHRDYLRNHNLSFEKTLAIGDVHFNLSTKEKAIVALPWDGPEIPGNKEKSLLRIKANAYLQTYAQELSEEIQADWNSYQVYVERQKRFLASQNQ